MPDNMAAPEVAEVPPRQRRPGSRKLWNREEIRKLTEFVGVGKADHERLDWIMGFIERGSR